jgi:hypothetical protein
LPVDGGVVVDFCGLLAKRLDTLALEQKLVAPFGAAHPIAVASVNRNAAPEGTGRGTMA